jgi:hypothetical protein
MNVALTRAKSSLYILGHASTLHRSNEDWKKIVDNAKHRNLMVDNVGSYFAFWWPLCSSPLVRHQLHGFKVRKFLNIIRYRRRLLGKGHRQTWKDHNAQFLLIRHRRRDPPHRWFLLARSIKPPNLMTSFLQNRNYPQFSGWVHLHQKSQVLRLPQYQRQLLHSPPPQAQDLLTFLLLPTITRALRKNVRRKRIQCKACLLIGKSPVWWVPIRYSNTSSIVLTPS